MTSSERESFEKFLLDEYEHIATAHFAAMELVSAFFKNYLVLVGLPLSIVSVASKFFPEHITTVPAGPRGIVWLATLLICAVGFCMMIYITNLQNLSLRYARTVNGIRNFFYSAADLSPKDERQIRGLPRSVTKPRFFRPGFLPTIFAFGLLDGAYPAAAYCLTEVAGGILYPVAIIVGSVVLHLVTYWALAAQAERQGKHGY